jgi:cytoskeletal protein CcmA (bactofilin family)
MDSTWYIRSRQLIKDILVAILVAAVVSVGPGVVTFAQDEAGPSDREVVLLTGAHADVQFLAGRSVTIKANVSDDVFAGGRDVTFDAATVNNAIVVGYDVEQRGGTARDFVAAAGNLRISGRVSNDLVAGARSIRVASSGSVDGDMRVAAETIDIEGRIAGSMRAAAQRITIAGKISGKVDLLAARIVVASGAEIAGDLIYRGKDKPEIAEGAKIGGQVRQIPIEVPDLRSVGWTILGVGILIGLAWVLATLLLVAILHWAFPIMLANAARQLRAHLWSSVGLGIAIGLITSAAAGALIASIIGIPLGSALLMGLGVALLMGLAAVSCSIGLTVRQWRRGEGEPQPAALIWWSLLGAAILCIVAILPVLGWIIVSLAMAAGLGAAGAELWRRLRAA